MEPPKQHTTVDSPDETSVPSWGDCAICVISDILTHWEIQSGDLFLARRPTGTVKGLTIYGTRR